MHSRDPLSRVKVMKHSNGTTAERGRVQWPCSRGLDGCLPGLLVGSRIVMGASAGVILRTGHAYGPGGGHDQAFVRFDPKWHAGDPEAEHPIKRRGSWDDEESWHYLSALEFAPENTPDNPPR